MKKSSSGNYTIYESTDPCELHKYSETLAKELEKKDNEIEKSLKESADNINELKEENILNEENITEIIDLLPKVSNEGESIALENTARAKFTKFRIEGNRKQETRSGYNLLNVPEVLEISIFKEIKINLKANNTYTFKFDNAIAGSDNNISLIAFRNTTDVVVKNLNTSTIKKFEIQPTQDITNIRIYASTDYSSSAGKTKTFQKLMIYEGTEDTEYEQYGTMPSEEFSSEIRNVGDNGNLYDKDNPNILDTPIDTSGLGGNAKNTYKTVWIPCKPNTTYTVSKKYDATKNRFALAYTSEEPNYSQQVEGYVSNAYTNVMTITTNSTAKYLIAYVWIAGGSVTYQEMLDSIKIERGVQATADSGYGCGNIEINTVNKNLLDQSLELFQGNYKSNGDVMLNKDKRIDDYIPLSKGDYILWSTTNNWINVLIYDKNKKFSSRKNSNTNKEIAFTLDEDGYIRFGFNPTVESLKVFQLERNTEKTTSEEHKQQIIIFPFNKGQRLMEGDYLAEDGIHHTKTQIVLDGVTNGLKVANVTKHSNNIYYCVINLVKQSINNMNDINGMYCSHFMPHFEVRPGSCYIAGSGLYLVLVLTDQTITTVDAANTWLATQKEKGTPVVIEYKLAEEEIETYTEVQKEAHEQIKNAISYKGQTNIFSTNEIKPIFEVEALADIGLLLNNMQAQILAGGE